MHTVGFAIGLLMSFPGAVAEAEEAFPYAARVVADQAYVRSGPGPDFYPTAKLQQGQQVAVYQHERDGYCAIRPPEGSFSWVAAGDIELRGDGVGEILEDRVPSRVGSSFSTIRDVVHVRLERGERVKVVGQRTLRGKKWHQVEPPSGEFRWIARQDLDAGHTARSRDNERWSPRPARSLAEPVDAPTTSVGRQAAGAGHAPQIVPTSGEQPRGTGRPPAADDAAKNSESAAASGSTRPAADTPDAEQQPVARAAPSDTKARSQQAEPDTAGRDGKAKPAGRSSPPLDATEIIDAPLAERLEQELSVMLAEESTVWEFGELRRSAQALLDEAVSTSDRVRARRILRKIGRLEDIKQRRMAVASKRAGRSDPTAAARDPLSDLSRSVPRLDLERPQRPRRPLSQQPFADSSADGAFAGIGTLRPVVSRRQNAPRYALVDQNGKVVSFVSPTGGLNLQPYVGRRIGITGNRGFMPQYSRPHVTAQRVTDFGTPTRITERGVDKPFR